MKTLRHFTWVIVLAAMAGSCTDDFASINLDPGLINEPNPAYLFTDAITAHGTNYTEWFYAYYNYYYRWNQATVFIGGNESQFNDIGATGGASSPYGMRGNLDEIRRQIGLMSEEDQAVRQHMVAITYIPPIYQGLHYTDRRGSMPWSEAIQGRYESHFTPKYDSQPELFTQWLDELNGAIDVLLSATNQLSYGSQDFIYQGDAAKWARLANSMKLMIAVRVAGRDLSWAQSIIQEAIGNPAGLIIDPADDFLYMPSPTHTGSGHDFWGSPSAARNFISQLVETQDPRTHFLYDPNGFDQDAVDTFVAQGRSLPGWIDPNDPVTRWDRYRGGPVAPDLQGQLPWYGGYLDDDGSNYPQLSHINRRFFNPGYQGGDGWMMEPRLTAADVALYMAEFLERGWISGPVMGRNVADWYELGVRNSIYRYDRMAEAAQVFDYSQFQVTEALVDDYLTHADVALNGSDHLEKILYQQFINFFRNANEQHLLVRRTGFPSRNGNILLWDAPLAGGAELPLPRRFPVNEPSNPMNIDNWRAAMQDQGWTHGVSSGEVLNVERVWYDVDNPNYGNGAF